MSAEDIENVRAAPNKKGPMCVLRFEDDPFCTAAESECIHKAFNDSDSTRVQELTLPGKGHSVLTLDFVDEVYHQTQLALADVLLYFSKQVNP